MNDTKTFLEGQQRKCYSWADTYRKYGNVEMAKKYESDALNYGIQIAEIAAQIVDLEKLL